MEKRRLLPQEINDITTQLWKDSLCASLPEKFRESVFHKIMAPLLPSLGTIEIVNHPAVLEELKKELLHSVRRSMIQAGEAVGILCAQSIGERQTQLTLNSFHSAGLAIQTVVSGVPRFLELLNATKEPKVSSNIFRLSKKVGHPNQVRDIIHSQLVCLTFSDLILDAHIFSEKEEEVWYDAFENVYTNGFRDFSHGISFQLNREVIYEYRVKMELIKNRLEAAFADIIVVFSPIYVGQMDVFVDVNDVHLPTGEDVPTFLTPDNYLQVFLEDVVKPKLMEVVVCGIPGIQKYHVRLVEDDWLVETVGSNFIELLGLPFLQKSCATSTNMWDIYETFGIEATRDFLIQEFLNVVSADGTFINPSHIYLLVDVMTHHGTINSISRYGMKKEQAGVLTRSSFEESLDQFCKAGFSAERDSIRSVSAAIMCGKRSKTGTGLCSLKMNWETICSENKNLFVN